MTTHPRPCATVQEKIDFHDAIQATKTCYTISKAAKALGIGRNVLFSLLREKRILMDSESDWNIPYQKYIDCGYFKSVLNKTKPQTLITGKGLIWLHGQLSSIEADKGKELIKKYADIFFYPWAGFSKEYLERHWDFILEQAGENFDLFYDAILEHGAETVRAALRAMVPPPDLAKMSMVESDFADRYGCVHKGKKYTFYVEKEIKTEEDLVRAMNENLEIGKDNLERLNMAISRLKGFIPTMR